MWNVHACVCDSFYPTSTGASCCPLSVTATQTHTRAHPQTHHPTLCMHARRPVLPTHTYLHTHTLSLSLLLPNHHHHQQEASHIGSAAALSPKDAAGDLYVVIDVALPRSLSEATRKAYEELARIERTRT